MWWMGILNPPGHPEIFVCGDLAHVEQDGRQIPGVAQPAMQMGKYAAKRIGRLVAATLGSDGTGKDAPFHYFDKGDMATIGRKAAIAKVEWPFKAHWSGFPAWMMWLVVHIFFLIGFRNRLSVFRQWAWTYLTFNDGVRLITGLAGAPGWDVRGETPVAKALDMVLQRRNAELLQARKRKGRSDAAPFFCCELLLLCGVFYFFPLGIGQLYVGSSDVFFQMRY